VIRTKTHKIVATLAATAALAVVAPAAAQAMPADTGGTGGTTTTVDPGSTTAQNDGRYSYGHVNSAALANLRRCVSLDDEISFAGEQYEKARQANDTKGMAYWDDVVDQLCQAWADANCGAYG
jgi:ABC-type transport system substrate-binding protein